MNPFKHLLSAAGGHPPVGTWISSASPLVAEAVAHAGFEWGVIDMEHSPLDMMDVVHLLQAVSSSRMVPVVRVPWNDKVTIKRVLDAGATTLLVPFVQSADEARARGGRDALPAGRRARHGRRQPGVEVRHGRQLPAHGQPRHRRDRAAGDRWQAVGAARGDCRRARRGCAVPRAGRPVGVDGPCRPVRPSRRDGADGRGGAALQGARQAGRHRSAARPKWWRSTARSASTTWPSRPISGC